MYIYDPRAIVFLEADPIEVVMTTDPAGVVDQTEGKVVKTEKSPQHSRGRDD